MSTIRIWLARAAVRLAILAAPKEQGELLEVATRPIWRPGAQ